MMGSSGLEVESYTCHFALKACTGLLDYETGMEVVKVAVEKGMEREKILRSAIIGILVRFGKTDDARSLFDRMTERDVVCWNSIIGGYVQASQIREAFDMFFRMRNSGITPSHITIVKLDSSLHYNNMGEIVIAHLVFETMPTRNLVSWNPMISGCVQNGFVLEAFALFKRLLRSGGLAQNGYADEAVKIFCQMQEGVVGNSVTLVSVVHSCAQLGCRRKGISVHAHLFCCRHAFDVVNRTSLIDVYAKYGRINSAELIFIKSSVCEDVVIWNSLITAYGIHGLGKKAVGIYRLMMEEEIEPDETLFLSLLTACSHSGLVEDGIRLFHSMEKTIKLHPQKNIMLALWIF
ncbi:hypothetical protein TIFTF001_028331 [Ficus carica]|uniref:Pentatricopeptide repeat-containing protein n=1 Tax=Ficus carica TaxID=3494 RepID=A0AA88DPL7_FICCA|nr:hypothetical protein TIFTF001_028331 [Ficus carica]